MMKALIAFSGLVLLSAAAAAMGAHSKDDPNASAIVFWGAGGDVDASDVAWLDSRGGTLLNWDAYAWAGGDDLKFRLEAEGETLNGGVRASELRALASWNAGEFWDLQAGVRQDFGPEHRTWATAGVQGLAPYFFETEARLFVSENGDVAFRLKQSFDFLLAQRLILQPHIELNAYAEDVPDLGVGAGLSDVEAGLQLRYEIARKFAPYIDVAVNRTAGETAIIARAAGADVERTTVRIGVRIRL